MRTLARLMAVVLLASTLAGVGATPADAQTKTFKPAKKQEYIDSLTVKSADKRWRFNTNTSRRDDVYRFIWSIDIGGHAGPEYILRNDNFELSLAVRPSTDPDDEYDSACVGLKQNFKAVGDGGKGVFGITVPQDCLRTLVGAHLLTKLRVRLMVEGGGKSFSPSKNASKYHGFVNNVPNPIA